MSFFDRFSKPKESTSSQNVEPPNSSVSEEQSPRSANPCQMDSELLRTAVPIITERANAMFEAGKRPTSFFLAIDAAQGGPVALKLENQELRGAVLVFTSQAQAVDYLRASRMAGEVHEIPATTLQSHMDKWKEGGAGAFVLDRCPRCPLSLAIPIRGRLTDDQVSRVWALHRTARIYRAQQDLRIWLTPRDEATDHATVRREKRKLLETIRDHLDCNVPYLHWMIALEAGMSKDDDIRLAAVARMQEFGSTFSGKATLSSEGDAWATAVAECHIGLLGSFEMLESTAQI